MIKLLEKHKEPLTKGMSILVIIVFFGFHLVGEIIVYIFSINETMGWKISVMMTWIDAIPIYSVLVFFGVYLILNILKIKTDITLSVMHLFLIALSSVLYNIWVIDIRILLFLIGFSFIIFIANIYKTLIGGNTTI